MKTDKFNKAISLLAVSLCATSVNATTNYLSEGYLSLEEISFATGLANFSFENTSTEDDSINLELSYSFSGEVEIDTPADQQYGLETLEIDLYTDNRFYQDIAIAMTASLDNRPFSGSSSMSFGLLLEASETEDIYASINSYGESESISTVPLPASILLINLALAGLVVRRKTV